MKGQDPKGKTQQKSCQKLRGSIQEPAVPSQPAFEKRRTPEHAPYPSRKDCSPTQPGPPATVNHTVLPLLPRENAQQALRNGEQRSATEHKGKNLRSRAV